MTEGTGAKDAPHAFGEKDRGEGQEQLGDLGTLERRAMMAWVRENLTEVRRTAAGERPVYWVLGLGLVLGLVVYVGGYLITTSTTTEPLGLIGDVLYALGYALWTGVVVAVFLQIIPEAKRRQYKRALDAYEAASREVGGAAPSHEASPDR